MAQEVGSLVYNLDIDDKGLKGKLDTADKSVQGFGDNVGKAGSNVKDTLNKAAVGIGIVGAGLTLYAKNATDFATDYVKSSKKLARETGASIEDSSRLLSVTNKLGLSTEQVSTSFGLFSKKINETNLATDKASTSLGQLGIATKNASGVAKPFNQILLEVSDKFKTLPNGATKTALAMDLFGRSGKAMIPFLNLGSTAIANLEKQADKLGLTLDVTSVDKISKLIASQKLLKQETDSLKIAVGLATAPVLTDFNTKLNEMLGYLLQSDGPMRTLTVDVLAFGGPVLSGTAALVGFGANLGTIITTVGTLGGTLAGFTAFGIFGALGLGIAAELVIGFKEVNDMVNKISKGIEDLSKKTVNVGSSGLKVSGTSSVGLIEQLKRAFSGFASGGSVSGNVPIIVGEKGPEMFIPGSGGSIVPNNKMGNGAGTNNTFTGNIYLGDSSAVKTFFDKLDRNIQLESMGLSPLGN